MRDNGGRRSGHDEREFSYTQHIPEKRSGLDRRYDRRQLMNRRSEKDRRQKRDDAPPVRMENDFRLNGERRIGSERRSVYGGLLENHTNGMLIEKARGY